MTNWHLIYPSLVLQIQIQMKNYSQMAIGYGGSTDERSPSKPRDGEPGMPWPMVEDSVCVMFVQNVWMGGQSQVAWR